MSSSSSSGKGRSSGGGGSGSSRSQQPSSSSSRHDPSVPNIRGGVDSGNNAPPPAAQRKVIGHYMLGKTIGEGTFGKVKIAIHLPTGEKVAVKILEKSRIKEQADVRRVNREIKILKKARHGNIIQLYEVLDTPNTIYLMMENAEGGEMFDYIVAHRYVPEMQACKFFHQIVDGVEMLHKNDITHRDLKPENLLLKHSSDGWLVKIVDFGLSNTHEGGKLLSTACGSPCYAAPEMIAGKQYVGPNADIWSMGVILFALVCGFLPFEDGNTSNLYRKIMAGEYKPAKWISTEVKDLIRRILEVDPRRRYTVEDIRKHPWYTMVADSAIPRDVVDSEKVRAETLSAMSAAGMDVQAVLDGISSHTCNSMTAMYYLLAQKQRGSAGKKLSVDKDKIPSLGKPHKANGVGVAKQQQQQQQEQGKRSRTPTPTSRDREATAAAAAVGGHAPVQPSQRANASSSGPSPRAAAASLSSSSAAASAAAAAQGASAYQQGGSSVLQKLQAQHQQRMNAAAMPSLEVYMGATGSTGEGSGAKNNAKAGVGAPPQVVVPKLNMRGVEKKQPLVSQTARQQSGGASDAVEQQRGAASAREALPNDALNFDLGSLVTDMVAMPMPSDLLGPMPDINSDSDRPSTRRSRLRSHGGDMAANSERPQSAAGGLDVPHDMVTNAAPVTLHNPDATSTLRVVTSTGPGPAPDASKRSSASSLQGGRKGKNIKVPASMLPGDMDPPAASAAAANANANAAAAAPALFQQPSLQAAQAAEECPGTGTSAAPPTAAPAVADSAVADSAAAAVLASLVGAGGQAPLVTPAAAQEQTAASDPTPAQQQVPTPNVVII